jgi:methyl-accepting chemotaxis protein
VVATMQGIHSASARIGDIIGVIDGIAFQTNILALNAAVEAARAGEQGRGFAVVASEVRSLAQRSAEAAKEIKALIQDATGRVDGGVRQVEAAGRTMDEIVGSVKKVNALVAEIAHASAEQLAGIEQVNRAIAQMDGNTQRNAALVQQAAESAQEMAGEAAHLVETVAKFKLADAQPAQAAQPAPREEPVTLRELPRRRQAPRFVATMPPDSEMLSLPAPLN